MESHLINKIYNLGKSDASEKGRPTNYHDNLKLKMTTQVAQSSTTLFVEGFKVLLLNCTAMPTKVSLPKSRTSISKNAYHNNAYISKRRPLNLICHE